MPHATTSCGAHVSREGEYLDQHRGRKVELRDKGVEARSVTWEGPEACAFPPLPITGKAIRKARVEGSRLILVALMWPAEPWFPELRELTHLPQFFWRWLNATYCNPNRVSLTDNPLRLALVRPILQSLGASAQISDLVPKAVHVGTNAVYSCHWSRTKWCQRHLVDNLSPSRKLLAHFLAFHSPWCCPQFVVIERQ